MAQWWRTGTGTGGGGGGGGGAEGPLLIAISIKRIFSCYR